MLVKCSFGDDIRRFTIDPPFTTFVGLEHQLATLYKIQRGTFKVYYTDNEGDKIYISTNEEFAAAVAQATGPSILRITIVESYEEPQYDEQPSFDNENNEWNSSNSSYSLPVFSEKEYLQGSTSSFSVGTNTQIPSAHASTNTFSPQTNTSSTNTNVLNLSTISTNTQKTETSSASTSTAFVVNGEEIDMDELFANPKFQERLATVLSHAISTRAFSQLLQNMIPQMTDILKESIVSTATSEKNAEIKNSGSVICHEEMEDVPPNVSLNSFITPSSSFSSTSSESSFEMDLPEIDDVEAPVEQIEEEEVQEQIVEEEEVQEQIVEEEVLQEETQQEQVPEPEAPKEEESQNQEEAEEPEQFVIVDNKPEQKKEFAAPILNSFLSLFKPKKNSPAQPQETETVEEIQIPNLEDILNQLEAMGFTDKEQNIKVLRFHKKFNEGLDEVIEDLLQQASTIAAESI